MEGAKPGAAGDVSESGWSNSLIFLQYLEDHFRKHVPGGLSEPVLLLLDGHRSHVSVGAVEWAREHNIILQVLYHTSHQTHTSHLLQPMDVGCFGPLQRIYNNLCHKHMRTSTATVITKYDICSLACQANSKALTAENLQSSFRKTGIYPVDSTVISADALAPSTVLNEMHNDSETDYSDRDENNNTTSDFFEDRTRQLMIIKSEHTKAKKPRNTLSKITSGRAITEPETSSRIIENVSNAACPKRKKSPQQPAKSKPAKSVKSKPKPKSNKAKKKSKYLTLSLQVQVISMLTTLHLITTQRTHQRRSKYWRMTYVVCVRSTRLMKFEEVCPWSL